MSLNHRLPGTVLATIEAALNRLLAGDSVALETCKSLAGKSLSLTFSDLAIQVHLLFHVDGIQLHEGDLQESDAELSLPAIGTAIRWLQRGAQPKAMIGDMDIRGDQALAEKLFELVQQIDFDPEDIVAEYLGDRIAARIGEFGRGLLGVSRQAGLDFRSDLEQGLLSDRGPLAVSSQLHEWMEQVHDFGEAIDRMQARLDRMDGQLASQSEVEGIAHSSTKENES